MSENVRCGASREVGRLRPRPFPKISENFRSRPIVSPARSAQAPVGARVGRRWVGVVSSAIGNDASRARRRNEPKRSQSKPTQNRIGRSKTRKCAIGGASPVTKRTHCVARHGRRHANPAILADSCEIPIQIAGKQAERPIETSHRQFLRHRTRGRMDSSRWLRMAETAAGDWAVRGIACTQLHEGQGWRPL